LTQKRVRDELALTGVVVEISNGSKQSDDNYTFSYQFEFVIAAKA